MHISYRPKSESVNFISRTPAFAFIAFLTFSSGCSVLVGNVKPVEEKSERYSIVDLAKSNPDWKALPPQSVKNAGSESGSEGASSENSSDVAYQSKKTASIISLNSSCRKSNLRKDLNLRDYSKVLLLGLSEINDYQEKEVQLAGYPAFETVTDGKMPLEKDDKIETVRLKTYVVKKEECLYDLMYIAKPDHFSSQETDFDSFVQSLKIK